MSKDFTDFENLTDSERLRNIKMAYATAKLDKDEALRFAEPLLKRINRKSEAIAKKYGRKARVFTFDNFS